MGPVLAIAEVVAEVAVDAAAAAASAAEAAVDAAIDAGISGAADALAAGSEDALDAGLDAAIDGSANQIARTAGGQAMKKLVDKVGNDAAKRCIKEIKGQVKDNAKDQAKQNLNDYINGKQKPPDPPKEITPPDPPKGVDLANPTTDQYVAVENYFKAVHGAVGQSRQNENSGDLAKFCDTAVTVLNGMMKVRQANQKVFDQREFDAALGTKLWGQVVQPYSSLRDQMKNANKNNATNDDLNNGYDKAMPPIQKNINSALDNTYIGPDIPEPKTTTNIKTQNPLDYAGLLTDFKAMNDAFHNAHNVTNKSKMIEYGKKALDLVNAIITLRQKNQQHFSQVEPNSSNTDSNWNKIKAFYTNATQKVNEASTRDDIKKDVTSGIDDETKLVQGLADNTPGVGAHGGVLGFVPASQVAQSGKQTRTGNQPGASPQPGANGQTAPGQPAKPGQQPSPPGQQPSQNGQQPAQPEQQAAQPDQKPSQPGQQTTTGDPTVDPTSVSGQPPTTDASNATPDPNDATQQQSSLDPTSNTQPTQSANTDLPQGTPQIATNSDAIPESSAGTQAQPSTDPPSNAQPSQADAIQPDPNVTDQTQPGSSLPTDAQPSQQAPAASGAYDPTQGQPAGAQYSQSATAAAPSQDPFRSVATSAMSAVGSHVANQVAPHVMRYAGSMLAQQAPHIARGVAGGVASMMQPQ